MAKKRLTTTQADMLGYVVRNATRHPERRSFTPPSYENWQTMLDAGLVERDGNTGLRITDRGMEKSAAIEAARLSSPQPADERPLLLGAMTIPEIAAYTGYCNDIDRYEHLLAEARKNARKMRTAVRARKRRTALEID